MGNYIMSKFSSTEPTVTRSCEKKRKLVATANSSSDDEATGADEENDDLENSINLILNYSQVRPDSGQTFNVAPRKSNSIRTFYPAIVSETDHGSPQSSRLSPGSRQSAKCQIKPELIRPIRKKMKSTSNYIYSTLFLNGENSDICVRALNRTWNLHKLYLCQSPYFDSMFKGAKWKESSEREIEIAIPDENISEKSLFVSFGSFYKEDIEILPIEVINVLACASLFSLDGLIAQCEQIMLENINAQTVLAYHDASLVYGVSRVSEKCIKWLSLNLMINDEIRLESIGLTLFERVLASSELMVIQVETDLYSLCKKWLYYQLNKSEATGKLDSKSWQKVTNDFYRTLIGPELTRVNLLDDEAYAKYVPVFRKIRMQHIINDLQSLKLIHNDRIIPVAWIEAYYSKNWLNLLFIDQDRLSNEFEIDPAEFEANCMRFGRILNNDQPATWRWVFISFHLTNQKFCSIFFRA